MKTSVKLETLLPVLPVGVVDSLIALEREVSGFTVRNAEVKRASVSSDAYALADGERAAIKYITTHTVDRVGEVLVPEGCWHKEYTKNPVVLWAHDYSQPPIGKSEWLQMDARGIKSKTVYANTTRGEEVWQLVKGGFINTSSVGFVPLERVYKGRSDWKKTVDKYNAEWSTDLEKDGAEVITTKWALLEYSDVPVPCNPDALVVAVAKGMSLSPGTLKQLGIDPVTMKTTTPRTATKSRGVIEIISDPPTKQSSAIEVIKTKRPDMTDHQLLNWRSPPV